MTVATLRMVLLLENGHSSRERRRQMQSIMAKLHRHFNVALAEADLESDPKQVVLAVATVARSRREARERLERVADAVAAHPRAAVVSQEIIEV